MRLTEMYSFLWQELSHIEDLPLPQSQLKLLYSVKRKRSLGRKAERHRPPGEILKECIDYLQPFHRDFEFRYDRDFFSLSHGNGDPKGNSE